MQLNKQQAAAAYTESPRSLVVAAAGSGKTRTLIERLAHLIESGTPASEILGFTFTRTAAQEMKKRLVERVGPKAHGVTLSTMHGVALSLIKAYGSKIGVVGHSVTVYSQWETDFLLRETAKECGVLRGKAWSPRKKDVDAMFSRFESKGIEPTETDPLYTMFKDFFARCKENNALPYSGLIHGFRLLLEGGHLDNTSCRYWKHLLVDEVQDLDEKQWGIVNGIAGRFGTNLFCVGDLSQSIFGFRGAVPNYLLEHQSEFEIFRLEANYRCHPDIVQAANRLIEHNEMRIPLVMQPMIVADQGGVSVSKDVNSAFMPYIVKQAAEKHGKSGITILARSHFLLASAEEFLNGSGFETVRIGAKANLTRSEEFRRTIAPLVLAVNPYDNFTFLIVKDWLEVGHDEYKTIRRTALNEGFSHFNIWLRDYAPDNHPMNMIRRKSAVKNAWEIVYNNKLAGTETHKFIESYLSLYPEKDIEHFLEWLTLFEVQSEMSITDTTDKITLMTIHASKGMEFPCVIVAGVNEEILPSKQAMRDIDGVEEERRLAYVAWTRAEKELILTVKPEEKKQPGKNGMPPKIVFSPISRFVKESGL